MVDHDTRAAPRPIITADVTPIHEYRPAADSLIGEVELMLSRHLAAMDERFQRHASETQAGMVAFPKAIGRYRILAVILGLLTTGGGATAVALSGEVDEFEAELKEQWQLEEKQAATDRAIEHHLEQEHVDPTAIDTQLKALQGQLGQINAKLDAMATKKGGR